MLPAVFWSANGSTPSAGRRMGEGAQDQRVRTMIETPKKARNGIGMISSSIRPPCPSVSVTDPGARLARRAAGHH